VRSRSDDKAEVDEAAHEEVPDPELVERPVKRNFSLDYKLKILEQARLCTGKRGALAALLRKEGLYTSHVRDWQQQYAQGGVEALRPKKPGPPQTRSPLEAENERLRRENERLQEKLAQAEVIIEVQKKVSRILEELPKKDEPGKCS
jgi:transposase-like protein